MPKVTSPSANSHSLPLIRGDPSARSVAMVLCLPVPNTARTFAANSGASFSISCQVAIVLPSYLNRRSDTTPSFRSVVQ